MRAEGGAGAEIRGAGGGAGAEVGVTAGKIDWHYKSFQDNSVLILQEAK